MRKGSLYLNLLITRNFLIIVLCLFPSFFTFLFFPWTLKCMLQNDLTLLNPHFSFENKFYVQSKKNILLNLLLNFFFLFSFGFKKSSRSEKYFRFWGKFYISLPDATKDGKVEMFLELILWCFWCIIILLDWLPFWCEMKSNKIGMKTFNQPQ
jgi:hypothetical protein